MIWRRTNGNVLLLCVVAIAILVTLTNIIAAQTIGRTYFTKRIADFNDYVLLLEDANVRYRKEFSVLEAETVELVEYYFKNQFYSRSQVSAFNGPNSHHNKYLKSCIANPFQKMIKEYYAAVYDGAKDETGHVNEEDLEADISELANFLYVYMMSYRMSAESPKVPAAYGMEKKMTDLTAALTTSLSSKGTFSKSSVMNLKRELFVYTGASAAIDETTLEDYLARVSTGVFATANIKTVLEADGAFGFEVSKIKQEVVFELRPEEFQAVFNGATYDLTRTSADDKLAVTMWVKEGEK